MKNRQKMLEEFARLTVRTGANVQKGQTVIVSADVYAAEVVRLVAAECWQAGAADVVLVYEDEACTRMRYQFGEPDTLANVPQWAIDRRMDYPKGNSCYIYIESDNPDLFAGIPADKVGAAFNARQKAMRPFHEMIDKNENQWNIVAVPSPAWAAKVFPDLPIDEAMDRLWDAIIITMRLDSRDPVEAWQNHRQALSKHCDFMNRSGITELEFKSGIGTDLVVKLADGNRWSGGGDTRIDGVPYYPNMPTEEIFSMPHAAGVNGRVVASMPLSYQGNIIENFSFTFKDGAVVDYTAEKGRDTITQMLSADEGAKHLGEVALVPYSSPIRRSGILFYSTLFDENAACHLALGSAYPDTMEGGVEMTMEQRVAHGCNDSFIHVDFMFGTADLSVVGITAEGKRITVFKDGEFAI